MKKTLKRLPLFTRIDTTEPDADAPTNTATRYLHDFWENSRQWHLQGQDARNPEHGHLIRGLLVTAAALAGVYDADESAGDTEVQQIIRAAESGSDGAGHAGTQMIHARTLLLICEHDKDARAYLNRHTGMLKKLARDSEAFYQCNTDFFLDLRGSGACRGDDIAPANGAKSLKLQ